MSYNATALLENFTSNGNSLVAIGQTANDAMLGGWLGIIIYTMIIVTMILAMKARGITSSGAFSSAVFIGFIINLLLSAINLIPNWFLYTNIVVLAIIGVVLIYNRE